MWAAENTAVAERPAQRPSGPGSSTQALPLSGAGRVWAPPGDREAPECTVSSAALLGTLPPGAFSSCQDNDYNWTRPCCQLTHK